jgi:hypothetical protein
MAVDTSVQSMVTTLAPKACMVLMSTGAGCTRIFNPARSAGTRIGFCVRLLMSRGPFIQTATMARFLRSRSGMNACRMTASSTAAWIASGDGSRNGIESTLTFGDSEAKVPWPGAMKWALPSWTPCICVF